VATYDYAKAQALAKRLISKYGDTTTVSRVVSTYDPVEADKVVSSVQTDPVVAVTLPANANTIAAFENNLIEDYKKGKIRFFYTTADELTFPIESGDLLIWEGKVLEVAGASPLSPAGTPVYYTVGARVSTLSALPVVP